MSAEEFGLVLSVFVACAVEAVEALTIVLAVGTTRSWPAAMSGVAAAGATLAALVAALGPALTSLPLDLLRTLVGTLLLLFGLQWLRKAILRASGLKPLHDELSAYTEQTDAARAAGRGRAGFDRYSFAVSFQGVLLEGLEVVFIVLTFGANQHHVGLAALAAGLAIVLVMLVGVLARAPLARVPENAMKLVVGVMLTSFGTFWAAQGAGAEWPGDDAALLVIIPCVFLLSLALGERGLAARLARGARRPDRGSRPSGSADPYASAPSPGAAPRGRDLWARARAPARSLWDFIVGEDWQGAVAVVLAVALTALLAAAGVAAWWVIPIAVIAALAHSMRRAIV